MAVPLWCLQQVVTSYSQLLRVSQRSTNSGGSSAVSGRWPLRSFRRWLDQKPDREFSQISGLHKGGRLALGMSISLLILATVAWVIWR
jgi:hypothetical protein